MIESLTFHFRYVQEDVLQPGDTHYRQFHKIFEMFKITEGGDGSTKHTNQLDVDDETMSIAAKSAAAQKKQREEEQEDEVSGRKCLLSHFNTV